MKSKRRSFRVMITSLIAIGMLTMGLTLTASAANVTPDEPTPAEPADALILHVSYDLNGGTWKPGEEITPYDVVAFPGDTITQNDFKGKGITPVREGYTFDGWGIIISDMDNNVLLSYEADESWDFDADFSLHITDEDVPDEGNWIFVAKWIADKDAAGKVTKIADKTPKTGDESPLALIALLMLSGGAVATGVVRKALKAK